jgi:hypothetical protein
MPSDPNPAKSIFMAALELGTPAERDEYLARACGGKFYQNCRQAVYQARDETDALRSALGDAQMEQGHFAPSCERCAQRIIFAAAIGHGPYPFGQ